MENWVYPPKKGKLPYKKQAVTYELEYGTDTLEMHEDAFPKDASVLIVDDLLATGGTARAVVDLVEKMGGKIAGLGLSCGQTTCPAGFSDNEALADRSSVCGHAHPINGHTVQLAGFAQSPQIAQAKQSSCA